MGEVYRSRDLHLDRDVAVKVLLRGALADTPARERFRREAHVLSRLLPASQAATELARSGAVFGSLPYMAPEQLRGDVGDSRTGVYAFGAMLFEMATGRRPFEKDRPEALMFEILHGATHPVRSLRPETPAELDRLIDSCLSKNPELRPASAGAV